MLKCWVDGGAKPNPGSLYGSFKVFKNNKQTAHEHLMFVDKGSNNQAEYLALISLLDYLIGLDTDEQIVIIMDSRLVVKQVTNVFKTRNKRLTELKNIVDNRLIQLDSSIEFKHIPGKQMKIMLGH